MKYLIALCGLLVTLSGGSQVVGKVTDEAGASLPYVNIYLQDSYTGTTTNADGNYKLELEKTGTYTLVYQFLGYQRLQKEVNIDRFPYILNVSLQPETTSLDEVVVSSDVNPADRIIRETIAKRKAYLEKTDAFTADFYSRGLWRIENAPEKILGQEIGDLGGGLDSTRSGIIYLSETISEIAVRRPNDFEERIVASKVSGNDNGFSFNSAQEANFSFYDNTVDLNVPMVSPIARNAFSYYDYRLLGAFYEEGKLINKIEVTPKRPKDRVFNGVIYIVEDDWQLYGLELKTNGEAIQVPVVENLIFRQNFKYDPNTEQWIKILQTIDFSFKFLGFEGDGRFTAGYSNYEFDPTFSRNRFGAEVLSFEPEANKKDSIFWKGIRPVPLTDEELNDYIKKDSLQVIRKSEKYLDSLDARSNKFSPLSPVFGYTYTNSYDRWQLAFEGPLTDIQFNTIQGWHGTLGLSFNSWSDENYTRYFSAFAKANYGFSDDQLRFTAGLSMRFNRTNRRYLALSGGRALRQFNPQEPISPLINTAASLNFERNYLKAYDLHFARIDYSEELVNGFRLYANLAYEERQPLFNTTDQTWFPQDDIQYTSNNPLDPSNFTSAAITRHEIVKTSITGRFRFGQKYMSYPDGKFNLENEDYPTLFLTYEKGFGASEDGLEFDQVRIQAQQDLNLGNKGTLGYNLKAGTFFNAANEISFVDYQHFNGNQTRVGTSGRYLNTFNLMPYYERSTNQNYLEGHLEHDFKGWILGKIPGINQLNFNLIAGAHVLATRDAKPYYEFSVGMDNIGWGKYRLLRLDYVRSYNQGDGFGALIFGLKFLDFLN
ncbi:DUF5686 and carboxypeptidase regulatory-like domain-containing protein [Croceiramulus getboli]|nr:DUF5686 and carboxypeptidase regulatory-like domain-containing protein [Flavobacteriaceae bacterium YJPT1-3]